jgi:hypothetical protein
VLCECTFDADWDAFVAPVKYPDTVPYGDYVNAAGVSSSAYGVSSKAILDALADEDAVIQTAPINFEIDFGQKTDTVMTTKQFVESKLVFATLHSDDTFPMKLTVHVDGDPNVTVRDLTTDAAFYKNEEVGGVLNTTFSGLSNETDTFNTLRQIVVRYSGKGKSVRHILSGQSFRNFKMYEAYVRYKLLNVKQ